MIYFLPQSHFGVGILLASALLQLQFGVCCMSASHIYKVGRLRRWQLQNVLKCFCIIKTTQRLIKQKSSD